MFLEITQVAHIALTWLQRSLQNEVTLVIRESFPESITNLLFMDSLRALTSTMRIIQLKKLVRNLCLSLAKMIKDYSSCFWNIYHQFKSWLCCGGHIVLGDILVDQDGVCVIAPMSCDAWINANDQVGRSI